MRTPVIVALGLGLMSALANAGTCPDPSVVEPTTEYERDRVWIHPEGWFSPLTDAPVAKLSAQGYGPEEAMVYVQLGAEVRAYPVGAMAYHHVANDSVGAEPVVVTY
jgi:hypothetical protein